MPAFQDVSDKFNVHEIKYQKPNSLYKEYGRATELAKLIIQKFGYNINNLQTDGKLRTPPFWIDMSKLFEMYVLGLLKEKYTSDLLYQFSSISGIPDFLLTKKDSPTVIDAKYKPVYKNNTIFYGEYLISDVRQLSGYARDKMILEILGVLNNVNVDCLIIYPITGENDEMPDLDISKAKPLNGFNGFYKLGINLPHIKI